MFIVLGHFTWRAPPALASVLAYVSVHTYASVHTRYLHGSGQIYLLVGTLVTFTKAMIYGRIKVALLSSDTLLLQIPNNAQLPELQGKPCLLVLNKIDVANALPCAALESALNVPTLPEVCTVGASERSSDFA